MSPFECYQHYLSLKSHFTNPKYDFFKYGGKSRATVTSFNKRKDKYWFEKSSRKYSDKEIVDYFLANFLAADNPQNVWIGEIINSGERIIILEEFKFISRAHLPFVYIFCEIKNTLMLR